MPTAASDSPHTRRRLALSWRGGRVPQARGVGGPRRPATYAPQALPERQPSLAALVPTSLGSFSAAAASVVVVFAVVIGLGLFEPLAGRPLLTTTQTRFTATVDGLRQCLDLRWNGTLAHWIGQIALTAAAVGSLVVGQLRRHRLDDRRGRHAAWGWLAALFLITSCAAAVPLGSVYGGFVAEVTGLTLGPEGRGWWILTAGIAYAAVGLWAVLPLYERAGTAAWLALCCTAWVAAGGCAWAEEGIPHQAAVGQAAWIAGAACAAIAMLAAARSVVREVRGFARSPAAAQRPQATLPPAAAPDTRTGPVAMSAAAASPATEYIDGEAGEEGFETDDRPLSKAERKRLRKLARMSRAA